MTMSKRKQKLLLGLSVIPVMLVFSGFTSPLYPHYTGLDSSIFLIIARGIVSGKVPYRDLFDHKGPVFFWMEALGYYLGGRTGVFFLQCLLLGLDLFFIDRISALFHTDMPVPAAAFAAVFLTLFEHGNLTEEFSMPLILCGLYFELRFLSSGEERHPPAAGFLYGLILGLIAFIRINNAAVLCALLLSIAVCLAAKGQWGNLFANIGMGILGLFAVSLPVCLYFYRRGILYDMLYGTFLRNMLYARDNTHYPLRSAALYFLFLFLPGISAFLVFLDKWRKEKKRVYLSLLTATVLTYGMLAYTNVYKHYFLLALPLFMTAAAVSEEGTALSELTDRLKGLFRGKGKEKPPLSRAAALVLIVTVLYAGTSAVYACAPIYKTYLSDISYNEYAGVRASSDLIPEEERDSVIGFEILANYYYHADILPCYKYFTLQGWMSTDKVDVSREFLRYLYEEHPLWIVTGADEKGKVILGILEESYAPVYSDENYCLYRYREE